ncbi:polyprotein [Phytophthora megakarya]|uniref:Polyprotein n=1 Tax=Phytophthora megakarya TaxID=4795 RepID=A0A225W922_9STRA|nr:polyprotein [Phytophthora megakarya]
MKLKFQMHDGMYRMRVKCQNSKCVLSVQQLSEGSRVMELLHNRLNHTSMATIKTMVANKIGFGLKVNKNSLSLYECVPCIASKMKRISYRRNPRRASRQLEKLLADICTINEVAADKSTMFLLVMDEYFRFKWIFLLSSKADSSLHLRRLIMNLEKQFARHKVVVFHADGGIEFVNNDFKNFCTDAGITVQYTHPDSPEENGILERANGTLVSRVRSMLNATQLSNLLWGEALLHAADTLNVFFE